MANTKGNNAKKVYQEMPHSVEAEQALLGCLLLDTKIQVETSAFLEEEDFYVESHKYIFTGMRDLISVNKPVDFVTLTDSLEKNGTLELAGGVDYIAKLTDIMPSSAGYQRYLDIVKRNSMLRKLIAGSTEIIDDCIKSSDEKQSLAFAEKTVFDLSNGVDTSEVVKIGSVIPEVMTELDELTKDKSRLRGIRTGYNDLDNIINGLHKSDLMILAARPSVGKTSLAMNIVENVALNNYSCLIFSLEMSKKQLGQRMLCSVADVSMEHALKGNLNKEEWIKMEKARKLLSDKQIFIDDSSIIKPSEMISKCRRIKRKYGLDFVVIDYIQLMTPDAKKNLDNRQQEITDISRNLKILAKEIDVPVLALSQLSRAVESEKRRPQLSDLRESGAIEQDADIVIFIHRPDKKATDEDIKTGKVKKNVAEILVEKNRSGRTGLAHLYFKGETTKFININEETGETDEKEKESTENENTYLEEDSFTQDEETASPIKSVDDDIF
ncbi:MAG: replicative DNA helicase [Clostridia bacterium]|nr:replicative DNA helicase [Clostridia bacterium]